MNKKKSVITGFVICLMLAAVLTMITEANAFSLPNTLGNGYNIRISGLKLIDVSNSRASGKADIIATSSIDGWNNVRVSLNMKNLPVVKNNIYEAWLMDNNGIYVLKLGKFTPAKNGNGLLTFQGKQIDFLVFDNVAVTMRSGKPGDNSVKVILLGDITGLFS